MCVYSEITIPGHLSSLGSYLDHAESRVPNLRQGCEKTIIWYDGKTERRDLAIIYIHGFSASRMETWPLCERLAEAMGANLFYTRLSGHGQGLAKARSRRWPRFRHF